MRECNNSWSLISGYRGEIDSVKWGWCHRGVWKAGREVLCQLASWLFNNCDNFCDRKCNDHWVVEIVSPRKGKEKLTATQCIISPGYEILSFFGWLEEGLWGARRREHWFVAWKLFDDRTNTKHDKEIIKSSRIWNKPGFYWQLTWTWWPAEHKIVKEVMWH